MSGTIATWSVPGCIWSSQSGKLIDPVFERRTEAERLTLWHILEAAPEYYPGLPDGGRLHHLFPSEAAARAYAETVPDCQVYPHDVEQERRRQSRKRGPGRPAGTTKPDADKRRDRHITITDAAWNYAASVGSASQYIESLILADKEAKDALRE